MKQFLVNIWAYDYRGKFTVISEDNPASLEQAILDKLGEKSIVWEKTGMYGRLNRITYEEVMDGANANTSERPLHKEEGSGSRMGAGAS